MRPPTPGCACSSSSSTASRCSATSSATLPCEAISAPAALEEYLREHGFGRVAKRLSTSGVIDVVATAAPGIDDIVVLGKIKQLERSGDWDVIVVDGPAAGHAITFLTSAAGLHDAVRGGPVRSQADDVLELLDDPARCQVVLVTLPETTPVNEVVETAYALEDRVGVHLGPVVVNDVDGLGGARWCPTPPTSTSPASRMPALLRGPRRSAGPAAGCRTTRSSGCGAELAARAVAPAAAAGRRAGPGRRSPTWRRRSGRPTSSGRGERPSTPRSTPVLDGAEVIVCCGSGGVGKTTTAAVIGLEAARARAAGRRRDDRPGPPAGRRPRPGRRPGRRAAAHRRCRRGRPGELWAMMLDTAAAFDALVRRNAADAEQVERILANPFYRNISGALSGTQEYMAAETLHQLHGDERFDLVVVDTPPSRNALDFLEASGRAGPVPRPPAVPAADAAGAAAA